MTWNDAAQVATVVIVALGGGGAIVGAFSSYLGKVWADRALKNLEATHASALAEQQGRIDAGLRRLDAALTHRSFLLQRFAEIELEGLRACWHAAQACHPLLNSTRVDDSGSDQEKLKNRRSALVDAHNGLVNTIGLHEPFLPEPRWRRFKAFGW